MTLLEGRRRQPHKSELFATERPPRLVLRFAIVLSLAVAVASALILVVVHHFAISEAERAATRHASLVASTLLQREVETDDLARPVSRARRRELDTLLRGLLASDDMLTVALVRKDGRITYSTDHAEIGTVLPNALAADAATGTLVSTVSRARAAGGQTGPKTLTTYAPVRPRPAGGAALIVQAYGPIESAARSAQLRVGGVLEALLVVLFLVLIPLLARVTRRIGAQIDRIHFQAYYDELTGLPNRSPSASGLLFAAQP